MNGTSNRVKVIACALTFVLCFSGFFALLSGKTNSVPSALAESVEQPAAGTLNYSDGAVYEGDVLYGRIRNGTGTLKWSTGETYSGEWQNDYFNGQGTLEWPGLGTYEGAFVNGKREGEGTFTWTYENGPRPGDPVSYSGSWTDDKIGPNGKMTLAETGTYEGEFQKQVRNGAGTFTWLNGDVYTGQWANDSIQGQGELKLADGIILKGEFAKGVLKNGAVTYSVEGGSAVRSVQNGRIMDNVIVTYMDGTVVSGKLKGGEFNGQVTIKYASGDSYEGTIKAGVKDGKGTYTWASGAHYVGEWANDKMSGNGKYYYGKDEKVLSLTGTFRHGLPSGTLVYVAENKLKYNTTWSNGTCTNITYKGK